MLIMLGCKKRDRETNGWTNGHANSNLILLDGRLYWVGASDKRHEGLWLWDSEDDLVQDFLWLEGDCSKELSFYYSPPSGQPNKSVFSNCMYWSAGAGGAGNDACSFLIYPLCQRI